MKTHPAAVPGQREPARATVLPRNLLVLGYGNPGRLDDGLGPAFVRALERARSSCGRTLDARFAMQLNVEDAADVASHDAVVFVDATLPGPGPFLFHRVAPSVRHAEFTTHTASPGGVLGLARSVFGAETVGFTLGIRGAAFGSFGETLSPAARDNLDAALDFFLTLIPDGDAHDRPPSMPGASDV